ncbi:MAG: hypothetical protein QM724_03470 [Flavobacteriales bacterium]
MAEDTILPNDRPSPGWLKALGLLAAAGLFVIGIWTVPLAIFGPDHALIPGDMGDARFNNYILEHGHRWIKGQEGSFWDAPFMYPWKNVVALSDNLLGTVPFYSALRGLGFTRESAFQGWLLLLFGLNYWCCFLALRKWAGHAALAACAAYIFAFGIYNIGQINNLQVMPKFMVPLAFLFFWRHLGTGALKFLLWAALATVYQFYCGVYIGFILVYGLFFLFVGHVVAFRRPSFLARFRQRRFAMGWLATLAVGLLLLAPMMLHYMDVPKDLDERSFDSISASIPRPVSYFFTHPAALSWRSLSGMGVDAFPQWWSHFHFIGLLPWLAVAAAPFLLFRKATPKLSRRALAAIGVGLALSVLFVLNIGGFTLYRLVFALPGFSVLRAVDRYIHVEVIFFLVLFVMVMRPLFRKNWAAMVVSVVLPVAVVQDNRWEVSWLKRFDKFGSRAQVQDVERRILREYGGPERWDAVAYEPLLGLKQGFEVFHSQVITTEITAMLAGQELGIPVVNAYTGGYPGNYISFFDHMDHRTLADWCAFNGLSAGRIQEIHGLGLPVVQVDTVTIRASNGKFLCANITRDDLVIADRDTAMAWEIYLRIRTAGGRVAFMAHNGELLFAGLGGDGRLAADGKDLGDSGLFTDEQQADGSMALKGFNGRYLSLDTATHTVHAIAERPERQERFEVVRHVPVD